MSGGGGKGDDKKVPTIDPIALIDAQTKANRVGVNTPFGSQAYSTDANGNAVLNTQLSPEMQALLTQQIGKASSTANPYVLPSQNASILNGLNTRLDQRYGMGLPPASGGNTGGGNTTPPPGGGGGTPPVTPPTSPPPSGNPGGFTPPGPSHPLPPGGDIPQGIYNRMMNGTLAGTERFAKDEQTYIHDLIGQNAIQEGILGPGAWASQGAYGAGQGSDAGGSIGGSYTPGMGSTGNNFGIPMPGSGTGNYSDPSSGMPGSLPGGYLGSGSYSGMGQGLSAAGTGTSGFGLPTGSVDLSGPSTSNYNAGSSSAPASQGSVSEEKKSFLAKLLQSRLFKAAAQVGAGMLLGPIGATGVNVAYKAFGNNQPAPKAPPPQQNDSSFYNY
jgi:hypothetical protein